MIYHATKWNARWVCHSTLSEGMIRDALSGHRRRGAEESIAVNSSHMAVNCYIAGEVWEKAKLLASQQCPDMMGVVEERYQ